MSPSGPKRPVHTIDAGYVVAHIWRRRGEAGDYFDATFETPQRKDGSLKTEARYSPIELISLSKAADQANMWISEEFVRQKRGPSPS